MLFIKKKMYSNVMHLPETQGGKIITTTTFHMREAKDDPNDLKISPLIITVHKAQWYKNTWGGRAALKTTALEKTIF